MTVTLSYDPVLSRVRIDATGLAAADYATIERSTDQIAWTTIRGGSNATVAAGVLTPTVDDYEFTDGVANYYRVRGVETDPITLVAHANTVSDANASGSATLSPTLPAGILDGDLLLLWANIRNKGVGSVAVPAGWTELFRNNNISLIGRIYTTGVLAPTVSFVSGAANATITAKIMALRSAALTPVTVAADTGVTSSQANIPYPALTVPADGCAIVGCGWRQDDATSVAPPAGMTEIQDVAVTVGDDVHVTLDYWIQTAATDIPAGSWVVTGGSNAVPTALLAVFTHAPWLNEQVEDITPTLGGTLWLKSISRPFLNQPINLSHVGPITRPGRNGIFDVIGRSLPIAVSDVRGSRRYELTVWTETGQAAQNLDLLLASGDTLFLHAPAGSALRSGVYSAVGDTQELAYSDQDPTRMFTLPLVEVAAPSADIVGATSTWQSIINDFATWADVIAAFPTWADVLEYVGDPSDVITP